MPTHVLADRIVFVLTLSLDFALDFFLVSLVVAFGDSLVVKIVGLVFHCELCYPYMIL